MEDINMNMSLVELYQLLGDNKGISFPYSELPGVVVTIGFSLEEDEEDEYGANFEGSDGSGEGTDGDDGEQSANDGSRNGPKPKIH